MVGFSDVLCRYSLGTNPRGVKEYVFIHYTLVTILVGLSVGLSSYSISCIIVTHACIIATHACIIAILLIIHSSTYLLYIVVLSHMSKDLCYTCTLYSHTLNKFNDKIRMVFPFPD
jgi:hypothetical protein